MFESLLIQADDPAGRQRRMIPLLLQHSQLPKRIAILTYLDFTQAETQEQQMERLVSAIKSEAGPEMVQLPVQRPSEPPSTPPEVKRSGCAVWWGSFSVEIKAAYIAGMFVLLAAIISLGQPILNALVSRPTATFTLAATLTPTPTGTPTSMWTPPPTATNVPVPPATPMLGNIVMLEIDGVASDDYCQDITCNSSPRIEVKVLDSAKARLSPANFSYSWRFNPSDPQNRDRPGSDYAIIYYVPCDRDNQKVTVEVAKKNGEMVGVKGVCFNIKK
jgi:hypothetical protein